MTQAGVTRSLSSTGSLPWTRRRQSCGHECVRDPLGRHHRLIREVVPASTQPVTDDTPVRSIAEQLLACRASAVLVSNAESERLTLVSDALRA